MLHFNICVYLLLSLHFHHISLQETAAQKAMGYDCSDIWKRNKSSASGIYTIRPAGTRTHFQVFCEMTVDGGWTLIQKHNGQDSLSFEREWDDYKMGFGNISGEHWLGLDNIYMLTNQNGRISELKIHLGAFGGDEAFALYNNFKIGPERRFYQLSLGSCLGDAGDAFRGRDSSTDQNHNFFSTSDKDHDQCKPCRDGDMLYRSCTSLYSSGWWFNRCGIANLNGNWHPEENHMYWRSSIQWGTWREYESLKFSMMMLRHH